MLASCGTEDQEAALESEGPPTPAVPSEALDVILITGSTDGMGRELARELGAMGAHVIVHGRNIERGTQVVRWIEEESDGSAHFIRADFSSFDEVREMASTIRSDCDRLDVLINNAGIGRGEDQTLRETSDDGHELRFQVNYLAGVLLTYELLPLLLDIAPAIIVNVASGAQAPIDFADVMLEEDYDGGRAYSQSKLAQILFTFDLAEQLEGTGVTVSALHPATMMPTTMVLERGGQPMSELDKGVQAVLNLVRSPDVGTGNHFTGTSPSQANAQAYDRDARRKLRELAFDLTGLQDTDVP